MNQSTHETDGPAPRPAIDLNADLGEGCGWDEPLLERVTSASICCGAHAGDPPTIAATLRSAASRGVVVGRTRAFRIARSSDVASAWSIVARSRP